MDVLEDGNIVGDLGTPDRDCAVAKSDIASRIVLVMEACRLMHEEAAAVTGLEPDQMRGISRGRFNSVSADELQAALEVLEAWENELLRQHLLGL